MRGMLRAWKIAGKEGKGKERFGQRRDRECQQEKKNKKQEVRGEKQEVRSKRRAAREEGQSQKYVAILSDPQYQAHCRAQFGIAIGSAHSRHRPAGGQPFRDVAARTAGAEHPTTVFVGCSACKIVCLKVQSDSLANLSQSTALGKYAGRVLKACCASYAQRACAVCFMPSNETSSSLGYVSRISRPRHILLHPNREEQQEKNSKRRATRGEHQEKSSIRRATREEYQEKSSKRKTAREEEG